MISKFIPGRQTLHVIINACVHLTAGTGR